MASSLNDWPILQSVESNFLSRVNIIAVSRHWDDKCALLVSDGEVFAVGRSDEGCLGLVNTSSTDVPCKIKELSGVAGVCVCGCYGDALAYTMEGKVYVWGDNVNATSCKTPTLVSGLTDVVDARCDRGHYLAVTKSGKVYEWRGNKTRYSKTWAKVTTLVTIDEVIVGIACSETHSLALTEKGDMYFWGMMFNLSRGRHEKLPLTKISIPGESIAKVACGWGYSSVLTRSGKLFTWGWNGNGLGKYNNYSATPVQVGGNIGRFTDIAANCFNRSAAITDTGAVYMWGDGDGPEIPTLTQHTELHQVFSTLPWSNHVWKCNSSDSINAAGSASNREGLEAADRTSSPATASVCHKNKKRKI